MSLQVEVRLTEDELVFCEAYAQNHGLAALLDHLGLDGLGNEVVRLGIRMQALELALELREGEA